MLNRNIKIIKARQKDVDKIVKIHKRCVIKTNAKFYSKGVINEWLKQISKNNVLSQFKNSSWYVLFF